MKAGAFQSTSESAPAKKQKKGISPPAPISPWFFQPGSALDGPVIQRKSNCACGGGCPACAIDSDSDTSIQTKLVVGEPHDQYEREADQIADYVVSDSSTTGHSSESASTAAPEASLRAPVQVSAIATNAGARMQRQAEDASESETEEEPFEEDGPEIVQTKAAAGRIQPPPISHFVLRPLKIQRQSVPVAGPVAAAKKEEEEMPPSEVGAVETIQAKQAGADAASFSPHSEVDGTAAAGSRRPGRSLSPARTVELSLYQNRGGGLPLPATTQRFMEDRLNVDLAHVRIHADAEASQLNQLLHSYALTAGADIYFAAGMYRPGTIEGQRLLAHELAHTMQQKGDVQRKIQRAMKFEFQTNNVIWAVKETGAPDPVRLPRKFAPTSVGYTGHKASEETGSKPAYLSVGEHGGPARSAGPVLVEVEGDLTMKEDKEADPKKQPQFIEVYIFTTTGVTENLVIGKSEAQQPLRLAAEIDFASNPNLKGAFNPNTVEMRYLNDKNHALDVHLDEKGKFQKGKIRFMKVGRKKHMSRKGKPDIDLKKEAQYVEVWKIKGAKSAADYLGKIANVKLISSVDNAKDPAMKNQYNPGTYEKNYYLESDFDKGSLKAKAKHLKVHVDKDGTFQEGHADLMVKQTLPAAEQTAMELQSETGGVVEFETPKWFRDWSELEMRIEDAVAMTKAIDTSRLLSDKVPADKKILDALRAKKKPNKLFPVVEWPKNFSTSHLKNLRKDNRRLLVEIVDPKWHATIQTSEGIALSEYKSLLTEHEGTAAADRADTITNTIFTKAFAAYKLKNKRKHFNETLFSDLKGFLQLVVTYIFRGSVVDMHPRYSEHALYAKAAFALMARANFASMFKELLNSDEKALFIDIVNDPTDPILSELQPEIDVSREAIQKARTADKAKEKPTPAELKRSPEYWDASRWVPRTLTRKSSFFFEKVGTEKAKSTAGPAIHDWLVGITKGKDLLSGPGISAAMGARSVESQPGHKEYKLAEFEVRASKTKNYQPVTNWVTYVKALFTSAMARSSDTPDDPRTPVNEASKTGLKM